MAPPARFPGYPFFIQAAADALGLSDAAAREARKQPAVNQIATFVSQLTPGGPVHPDTARRMGELRDGLLLAARAADGMIAFLAGPKAKTPPDKKAD